MARVSKEANPNKPVEKRPVQTRNMMLNAFPITPMR